MSSISATNPIFKEAEAISRVPVLGGVVSALLLPVAIIQTVVAAVIAVISGLYAAFSQSQGAKALYDRASALTGEGLVTFIFHFLNMITLGLPLFCISRKQSGNN